MNGNSWNTMSRMIIVFMLVFIIPSAVESREKSETYINKKYGVQLLYPSDFTAIEGRDDYWKFDYTVFKPKNNKINGNVTISYDGPKVMTYAKDNVLFSFFMATAYAEPPPPMDQGKIKVDGIEGTHEVMVFGNGEIHDIVIRKNGVKFDISASWGDVSDFAPQKPLPDYAQEKKLIMDALNEIVLSLRFVERVAIDNIQH